MLKRVAPYIAAYDDMTYEDDDLIPKRTTKLFIEQEDPWFEQNLLIKTWIIIWSTSTELKEWCNRDVMKLIAQCIQEQRIDLCKITYYGRNLKRRHEGIGLHWSHNSEFTTRTSCRFCLRPCFYMDGNYNVCMVHNNTYKSCEKCFKLQSICKKCIEKARTQYIIPI